MTKGTSGRAGGKATAKRRGSDYMVRIGRKGGKAAAASLGAAGIRARGIRGGKALAAKRGPGYYKRIGKLGGKATAARGADYAKLGRKGARRLKDLVKKGRASE